jgi:hypothetical protein
MTAPEEHRNAGEPEPLRSIRRFLLFALITGFGGMATELLLIGHVEGAQQLIPVLLLPVGVVVLLWHARRPRRLTVRLLQATMGLCVISGALGIGLHYRGNEAFELEMYPTLSGSALVGQTLTGATPVLAPGSMSLLGLVGLAHAYRHPSLRTEMEDR